MNYLTMLAAEGDGPFGLDYPTLILLAGVLIIFGFFAILARRYKRCPSNRVLIIYGKTSQGRSAKCLHGGGAFVIPLIQNYDYLSLDPLQIEIPLEGALSIENIRVNVPSVFTVAIGTEGETMANAAIRLLGLTTAEISKQAEDIIFGQLRQVIASMAIQEINRDRDTFLASVQQSLEPELAKIGLILINVNIKDITDDSGYIEAIGKKAASEAIQQAIIDVAQQERHGAIGVAEAERERFVQVAEREKTRDIGTATAERERSIRIAELEKERIVGEKNAQFDQESEVRDAEREMRIRVADANAKAVTGENTAKAEVAYTNADLKVLEADAFQRGETRRREADAAVREAQYLAEAKAAEAEGTKIEAEKRASLEASAKAEKAQTIVDAQAQAEKTRIQAEGEAAAIFAKLDAEAKGQFEVLAKKGQGLREIISACGGADEAFKILMLEHIEQISATAATAISNIKFDKVVVWDGGTGGGQGGGSGGSGGSATAGFLRGLAGSLPPAMHLMKDIAGVELPQYFGKLIEEEDPTPEAEAEAPEETKPKAKQPPAKG
jgi:flotillin